MADARVRRRALVIGSQCTALGEGRRLSFLPGLAEQLYDLLVDPDLGACAPAIPDAVDGGLLRDPTSGEIHAALDKAFRQANEDGAVLLVALIGHGLVRQRDFYFLGIDATDGKSDHTQVFLTHRLKGLLDDYSEVDGLLVWVDACQSGVAVSEAAAQWSTIALRDTGCRFEVLSAADDRAAYRGDFTRALIETVGAGVPWAGNFLDANTLRRYLQEGAKDQVPQGVSIYGGRWVKEGDRGLWLAKNRAHFSGADDVARRVARARVIDLTAYLQPTRTLDALVTAAQQHSCVVLTGPRGTGKSTLAAALSESDKVQGSVPTRFAQAITFADPTSTMDIIAGALAGQLRGSVEGFGPALTEYQARLEEEERAKKPALERWIRGPLGLMRRRDMTTIRLVIDGVDELDEPTQNSLRSAVSQVHPHQDVQLQFVLTARPGAVKPIGAHEVAITAPGDDVIRAYMRDRGVVEEFVPGLVSRASGNWLQAYLLAGQALQEDFDPGQVPAEPSLTELYEQELLNAGAGNRDRWEEVLRPVLAVAAAAGVGPLLPIEVAIAATSSLGGPRSRTRFHDGLVRLSGLIVRDQPGLDQERVGMFHQSLCDDYIFRTEAHVQFPVDVAEAHSAIADALRELAPPDMYNADNADDPLQQYAILTEPEHLWASGRIAEVLASLNRPRRVRPPDERDRWRLWSKRLHDRLGPEHADSLAAREKLACFVGLAGDPGAARDQYAELMPALEKLWGTSDERTLDAKNTQAYNVGTAGDPKAAVEQYRLLVPQFEKFVGSDAPSTLTVKENYARFLGESGNPAAARDQLAQLVAVLHNTLGQDAFRTLRARSNLAKFTADAGDPMSALDQLCVVAPALDAAVGNRHLDTLAAFCNLARCVGEYDPLDARDRFERLHRILVETYGPEHINTKWADFDVKYWTTVVALRAIHGRRKPGPPRTSAVKKVDDEFALALRIAAKFDTSGLVQRVEGAADVDALYQLGRLLEQRQLPAHAQTLYWHAAEAGHRGAKHRLRAMPSLN
jgi:energy-coupling factor transporter ATP-binding protein EcfA2